MDSNDFISYITTEDGIVHPLEALVFGGLDSSDYQLKENIDTTLDASSDDSHYPSASEMWRIVGNINSLL